MELEIQGKKYKIRLPISAARFFNEKTGKNIYDVLLSGTNNLEDQSCLIYCYLKGGKEFDKSFEEFEEMIELSQVMPLILEIGNQIRGNVQSQPEEATSKENQ